METKLLRFCGMVGLILIVSLMIFGCGKDQAPPPAQTPPPAAAPAPAPPAAAPPAAPSPAAPAGTPATATPGQPAAVAPSQDATQIQMGMSGEDVKKIMGEPGQTKQKGAMVEWKWVTPKGKVEVNIQDNKVVGIEKH
jgi:hypothetical protein